MKIERVPQMLRLRLAPELLSAVLRSRSGSTFAWGTNDCALFASDCALAMTGVDFAAQFRGKYKTALGARKIVQANGGLEVMMDALGIPRANDTKQARLGDIGLVDGDGALSLAVCGGAIWILPCVAGGLSHEPFGAARVVWRIG